MNGVSGRTRHATPVPFGGMRVLETPQPWIVAALALIALSAVLLSVGRRRGARATASAAQAPPGPSQGGPATRMLHGGAAPSRAAAALGVDEDELAHRVAVELGLLPPSGSGHAAGYEPHGGARPGLGEGG